MFIVPRIGRPVARLSRPVLTFFLFFGLSLHVAAQRTPAWQSVARSLGGSANNGVALVAPNGDAVVTGNFSGPLGFGTLPPLLSSGNFNSYLARQSGSSPNQWQWAQVLSSSNTGRVGISDMAWLPGGDLLVVGNFFGTVRLGSFPALTSAPGVLSAGFMARLEGSTGRWLWLEAYNGPNDLGLISVVVAPNGDLLLSGYFAQQLSLGTLPVLRSAGPTDAFVARLDGQNRQGRWAVQAGGSEDDGGGHIGLFANGDIFWTGTCTGSSSFGALTVPGPAGSYSGVTARLSATGQWQWATAPAATDGTQSSGATLAGNDVVISGRFRGDVRFPGLPPLVNAGFTSSYVARLAGATGQARWVEAAGGAGAGAALSSLTTTPDGNVAVAGTYSGLLRFGTTGPVLSNAGGFDVFAARLDATAGQWQWAVRAGGPRHDEAYTITALTDTTFVVAGTFAHEAVFGTLPLLSTGDSAPLGVFVARLTPTAPIDTAATPGTETVTLERDSVACQTGVTLRVVGAAPGSLYRWNTGAVTAEVHDLASGRHSVRISTPAGRQFTLAAITTRPAAVRPPNVITPNEDGRNETFRVDGLPPGTRCSIFSRWGQRVYYSTAYAGNWNASGLPAGLYYYLLEHPALCPQPRLRGWVEVMR